MSPQACWEVERITGSAGEVHARPVASPARRLVSLVDVERPALVLGSTQPAGLVDARALGAAGVELARRNSGGGAVLVEPGACLWVDVVVPRADPLWDDDVGRSFTWLGRAWVAALADVGVEAHVHDGPLQGGRWSRLVCFAGLGPGEVSVAGSKLVGLAQRRSRSGARFQCAVVHHWDPQPLVRLLALPAADRAEAVADLSEVAVGYGRPFPDLVDAFVRQLPGP